MEDYVNNLRTMIKDGYNLKEVAENIYLNYHSVFHTDEVYRLRKDIALAYRCDLNNVKLIGSAHTGYTVKSDGVQRRDEPHDFDFAIIDPNVFIRYFHKVDLSSLSGREKNEYTKKILCGKLHPRYVDSDLRDELEKINKRIMSANGVTKHISICFYLSEQDFIDGLVQYNQKIYSQILKDFATEENTETSLGASIGEMCNLSGIMSLDKM